LWGYAILLAAFLVGTGRSGEKGGTPAKKVYLPKYWSKLGLSADQKKKILQVQADYAAKIQALQNQIDKLVEERKKARFDLLTEDQKEHLRKIIAEKAGAVEKATEKKSSTDKKASKDK
jgi:hypothetical protein